MLKHNIRILYLYSLPHHSQPELHINSSFTHNRCRDWCDWMKSR